MAFLKTLSDLRTAVRDNLDESTAAFWTNAQLLRFLNRAKDRVWNEVRKMNEDYFLTNRSSTDGTLTIFGESYAASSFQIVAGTREYTLPQDFITMKLIECITSNYEYVKFEQRDLSHPDMKALRSLTNNQAPSRFLFDVIGERTLTIAPKSDTTLDLRIWYIQQTADLSADSDSLTMAFPLYMAVEAYATASALKMDRDPNAAVWEQTGNRIIADLFGANARQIQDPVFVQSYLGDWTGLS